MNVQDLCSRLREIDQIQLSSVLEDSDRIADTDFPEALDERWLADNIQAVFETSKRSNSRQDEMIGDLESNAFLAAFQKAYEGSRRTRIRRWAAIYSIQQRTVSEGGPLAAQLPHIGVKVEDEFMAEVLPLSGGSA